MRKQILTASFLIFCPLLVTQQIQSQPAQTQSAMDNASVIKMVKAGLPEDLIVSTINSHSGTYNTTADGLIALKRAGAGDKVLAAIVLKASGVTAAPASGGQISANQSAAGQYSPASIASGPPAGITEPGVYFKDRNGAWSELLPEVVYFKSAGVMKSVATAGVMRQNLNGHVQGSRAKISMSFPVELAVYMPEGAAITEYQLLRLHIVGDAREFRSVTGGAFHSSGGDARDEVEYQSEKIAPRVYHITLSGSFGRGEYGLLPPSAASSSKSGSQGKLYTISMIE
jgi:hypothetical protein